MYSLDPGLPNTLFNSLPTSFPSHRIAFANPTKPPPIAPPLRCVAVTVPVQSHHERRKDTISFMSQMGQKAKYSLRADVFRGRAASYLAPPAQIRTGPIRAYGSHLGCLTANRLSGHG